MGKNGDIPSPDKAAYLKLIDTETQFYSTQNYSITKLPSHICIVTSGLEEQMKF